MLPESWQEIEIFAQPEARNLPTCDRKIMMTGPTIILWVLITCYTPHQNNPYIVPT